MITTNGVLLGPNNPALSSRESLRTKPLGKALSPLSLSLGFRLPILPGNIIGNQTSFVFPTQSTLNHEFEVGSAIQDGSTKQPNQDHAPFSLDEPYRFEGSLISRKEKVGTSKFPAKLHDILARTDLSDIITWCPHGRAWKVLQPKVFEENIIPMYFRHCKYNSFTRQVNGWGFRRITQGRDQSAYYHEVRMPLIEMDVTCV